MPDYTKQLDEIVKALNRPATPLWVPWLIVAFSTVLGVIGGFIGHALQILAADEFRRRKMRRVLYLDLGRMFLNVDSIMNEEFSDDHQKSRWQEHELRQTLLFSGEKYCQDNHEIYTQLPERVAAEILYSRFHLILNEQFTRVNTDVALRCFAKVVRDGYLQDKYIKSYFTRKQAATLLRKVDRYQREDDELRKRMNEERPVTGGSDPPVA